MRGDIAGARAISIAMYLDDREMLATWFDGFEEDEMSSPEFKISGPCAEMIVRRGRERDARHLLERTMPDCELPRNGFESC